MKQGYKTTEFWATVGTSAATLIAVAYGNEDLSPAVEAIFAGAGAIVVSAYSISRAFVKRGEQVKDAAAQVVDDLDV